MKPIPYLLLLVTLGYLTGPLGALYATHLGISNGWSDFDWVFNGLLAALPMLTGVFFLFSSRLAQSLGLVCLLTLNLAGQTLAWLGTKALHGGEAGFLFFPVLVGVLGVFIGVIHLGYRFLIRQIKSRERKLDQ